MEGIVIILCVIVIVSSHHLGDGHHHGAGHDKAKGHYHGDGHEHVHDAQHYPGDGHHHGAGHDKAEGHSHGDGHEHVDDAQQIPRDGLHHGVGHDKAEGHYHGDGHEHVDDEQHYPGDGHHHGVGHDKAEGHSHGDGHKHVDARTYLTKFGYLNPFSFGERSINDSIKIFQNTFGLKETGVLDKETVKLMETSRCGMQDHKLGYSDRSWSITDLTYSFDNYTPDMDNSVVQKVIQQALEYWGKVTPLTFTRKEKDGDILISFGTGAHSDARGKCDFDFDGRNGVLAHAFFPENGRIHFDDEEYFTAHSQSGINFLWVATHELGHILGLEHDTQHSSAVMYPYYRKYTPGFKLHENDIKRIRALYGSETGQKSGHASGGSSCHDNCRDVAQNCWKFKQYCDGRGGSWTRFLERKCKRTCGHCC